MLSVRWDRTEIEGWLRETDAGRLRELYLAADAVRARVVGPEVHLRALVEVSNHCVRQCGYCGLRAGHAGVKRYRMTAEEVLGCARQAAGLGYGTIVMQAGEDPGITREWLTDLVRRIKGETGLAVTLSMGERTPEELAAWRAAGADRYLLRFETSDPELYALIHPPVRAGVASDRVGLLRRLREMGYEIGSGIMAGIPGQTYVSVAADVLLFRELELDMIGVGPYIAHPETPLGRGEWRRAIAAGDQAPATEAMVYKIVALTRLACPEANIPSTTALATINPESGRELGLARGANVIMPNMTPVGYRAMYEIYPNKACVTETAAQCNGCIRGRIEAIGRCVGVGPGGRRRGAATGRQDNRDVAGCNCG